MPKKKLPQTIEEFFVAGLGLAEGLDARNAADLLEFGPCQLLYSTAVSFSAFVAVTARWNCSL